MVVLVLPFIPDFTRIALSLPILAVEEINTDAMQEILLVPLAFCEICSGGASIGQ